MIPAPIKSYVAQGLALFTSEYNAEDAPQIRALTAAYLQECDALEAAIWQVIQLRQLANLVIYSPLAGTFTLTNSLSGALGYPWSQLGAFEMGAFDDDESVIAFASVDQTGIIIPGLSILTFALQPGVQYPVVGLDPTGTIVTLATPYTGPDGVTTATQNLENSLMDTVGGLVGQPRLGFNDFQYLSVIYLRIQVNRSFAVPPNWSAFAAIILKQGGGPVVFAEGNARMRLSIWNIQLDPIAVAGVLAGAVTNGVGGQLGYSTWPDGNDFSFSSRYDSSAGEAGYTSRVDSAVGGVLVADSPLPPV